MLRLLLQKLLHKKWMISCLLLGNILLISVAAGYPMYKNASIARMMKHEFEQYNVENYKDVGLLTLSKSYKKGDSKNAFFSYRDYANHILENIGGEQSLAVDLYTISSSATPTLERDDIKNKWSIKLSALSGLQHRVSMIKGELFSDQVGEDGVLEAIVSRNCYIQNNFILGDVLNLTNIRNEEGKELQVRIVGVFEGNGVSDTYWANDPNTYTKHLFISDRLFEQEFLGEDFGKYSITGEYHRFLDYHKVEINQIASIIKNTKSVLKAGSSLERVSEPGYLSVLQEISAKLKKTEVTLPVLQIPVLVLLSIFLVMISKQMLSMEQNEISVLKSRGASKKQIVGLYLIQSIILSAISAVIGILLGAVMCRAIGSTNEFMKFVKKEPLDIIINLETICYIVVAILFSILLTVLPVIKYSGVSIVNLKRSKTKSQKPFWQKIYLDVVLIGISFYGYTNFIRNKENIIKNVMAGDKNDPLLYLCSSLFLLGTALLFVRIQPFCLKFLYFSG